MLLDRDTTLASLVLDHPEWALVFQERHIDFCSGDATLAEACAAGGLDEQETRAALERALAVEEDPPRDDPRAMATPTLVAHIVSSHHQALRAALPLVRVLAVKVAGVHGQHNPKLIEVWQEFHGLDDLLEAHLRREEEVLSRHLISPASIGPELAGARREHLELSVALRRIRELADDFIEPDWACTSYRTLLAELRALEAAVLRHVLVENHVLFPRLAA